VHAHPARVPRQRRGGHRLRVLAEGQRVEHPRRQPTETGRDLAHHLGSHIHALNAGDDLVVVARPQDRIVDVVQVHAGGRADRAAAVDHRDPDRRVALAQQPGHDRAHDSAADDQHIGMAGRAGHQ
jgi:hypothetical protein